MRHRTQGRTVLETRVEYVEGKLDDTIRDFKEAVADLKGAMLQMENRHQANFQQMEARHQANFQQMEARHQANFTELKGSLDKSIAKAETSKNWVIGLVITVAIAVIGFILMNGVPFQT